MMQRRDFLQTMALAGGAMYTQNLSASSVFTGNPQIRTFHVSIGSDVLDNKPELFNLILHSGISDVWLIGFINGYWVYPDERIVYWRKRFLRNGISVHMIHIPLGHPYSLSESNGSGSLGIEGEIPNITPKHWKKKTNINGATFSGVSIHPRVIDENIEALYKAKSFGFKKIFFDDDFRLGNYPGQIGGCFCPEHKQGFLNKYGYNEQSWNDLSEAVRRRDHSEILHSWVDYTCDELTSAFKTMQSAVPGVQTGIMVMYLGAEKSGIRLNDYNGCMMRVGELMFDDRMFGTVKGKTDELFSSLFHRRYVTPELAFSETTAYPPENLSARNLAAKLNVSLLSDVRNTMLMSGLTPYPVGYWPILTPAMKKNAQLHEKVAGQIPRGPFKHFWGDESRYVGNDNSFSLFLAAGVPFEVTDKLDEGGWTFLAEFDAKAVASGKLKTGHSRLIHNVEDLMREKKFLYLPEKLDDIFRFKQKILPEIDHVPYVVEDLPVVCAWYPGINSVLLWNLSETSKNLTVKYKSQLYTIKAEGLNAELVQL